MRWLLPLILCACMPIGEQVFVTPDPWTGATLVTTQEREIYRDPDGIAVARPAIVVKDGQAAYAVLLNVRRRDANGPRIDKVTSLGHTLPYSRHDRLRTHCIDGCQKAEVGAIHLSPASFRAAARAGLPLRIWGKRGRYHGIVPAEAFARVLAQVRIAPH